MRCFLALSAALIWLSGCALGQLFGGAPAPTPPVLDPDLVQRGAALFRDPRVSGDGGRSCATCHPAGGADHGIYREGEPVEAGSAGGRRTQSLRGLWQTAPYFWDGSAATVAAALERMLAVEMRGGKLAGKDPAALEAYLLSLAPFDRGRALPDGSPVEPASLSARRGFAVFVREDCGDCHAPPSFARAALADVGTGGRFSVPTLRGVSAAGPFGHDGRWPDLETALREHVAGIGAELGEDEHRQLLAYLALL